MADPLNLKVQVEGDRRVIKSLNLVGKKVKDFKESFAHVLIYLIRVADKRFQTSAGGKWQLSKGYRERGTRPSGAKGYPGNVSWKPLLDTRHLNRSVTVKGWGGNIHKVTPTVLEWGTNLEYAEKMWDWSERQGEPFLTLTPEDEKEIRDIIDGDISKEITKEGLS